MCLTKADQNGFTPERSIGDTLRLVYDVLFHTKKLHVPRIILLFDFATSFDSISRAFYVFSYCLVKYY